MAFYAHFWLFYDSASSNCIMTLQNLLSVIKTAKKDVGEGKRHLKIIEKVYKMANWPGEKTLWQNALLFAKEFLSYPNSITYWIIVEYPMKKMSARFCVFKNVFVFHFRIGFIYSTNPWFDYRASYFAFTNTLIYFFFLYRQAAAVTSDRFVSQLRNVFAFGRHSECSVLGMTYHTRAKWPPSWIDHPLKNKLLK